jgi:pimeloyl-ACP methyl ester carboxylesterase
VQLLNSAWSHALLYFGGKGEAIEHRARELARWFPKHHIYLIPYRGYGPNRTMIPQEKDLKSDALSFFDAISQEHSHIDVIGRSMGTTIALFLTKYRPVRRLSLITPYYSISQLAQHRYPWVPVRWILKDKFDAWKYAHALQTPLLAVISITDRIIPMEQWERLKKLMTQPIEEFFIEDEHDLLLESEELWSKLANFFEFDTIST